MTSGPFANMTVNLGPDGLSLLNGKSDNSSYAFGYNPRCLKRSLTDDANRRFANEASVRALLTGPTEILDFELTMQGYPGTDQLGVHGGGHFSLGEWVGVAGVFGRSRRGTAVVCNERRND